MERGRRAPSVDGDLTAESIVWAAVPTRWNVGRIPTRWGPCSTTFAANTHGVGIDGTVNPGRRRLDIAALSLERSKAPWVCCPSPGTASKPREAVVR